MYYREGADYYWVVYYDGNSWGDEREMELAFDDGSTLGSYDSTLQECLENVDVLVYKSGGTAYEGAFFRERDTNYLPGCFSGMGIVYAEHRN